MTVLEDVASPPAAGIRPRTASQRERWQRRLPLLPALVFTLVVTHVAWLSAHAYGSVIVVMIWQWTPFMTLIMLAGLQGQPPDILEAAKVDGAGAWATFRELTLPHLRPYIELGILLGSIYLVNA